MTQIEWCQACKIAKAQRKPYPMRGVARSQRCGEVIHTDLAGPFSPSGDPKQTKYIQLTIDDHSRYMWINLLQNKSDAEATLQFDIKHLKNLTQNWVTVVYRDLGGETASTTLAKFMEDIGAKFHTAPQGHHQRNAIAESNIRKVQDMLRTLLAQSRLPSRCWTYAAKHAVTIFNLLVGEDGRSPHERLHKTKPLIGMMRPFGCRCVIHLNKEKQKPGKLDVRGKAGRYVGYNEVNHTHMVLLDGIDGSVGRNAVESINVDFDSQSIINEPPSTESVVLADQSKRKSR